jgi:hypothetical protein
MLPIKSDGDQVGWAQVTIQAVYAEGLEYPMITADYAFQPMEVPDGE